MTVENVLNSSSAGVLTREQIGWLELAAERTGAIDPLAQHILAGRVRRDDLFDGITPKTPMEIEREVK